MSSGFSCSILFDNQDFRGVILKKKSNRDIPKGSGDIKRFDVQTFYTQLKIYFTTIFFDQLKIEQIQNMIHEIFLRIIAKQNHRIVQKIGNLKQGLKEFPYSINIYQHNMQNLKEFLALLNIFMSILYSDNKFVGKDFNIQSQINRIISCLDSKELNLDFQSFINLLMMINDNIESQLRQQNLVEFETVFELYDEEYKTFSIFNSGDNLSKRIRFIEQFPLQREIFSSLLIVMLEKRAFVSILNNFMSSGLLISNKDNPLTTRLSIAKSNYTLNLDDILIVSSINIIDQLYSRLLTKEDEAQPYLQNLSSVLKKGNINKKKDLHYLLTPFSDIELEYPDFFIFFLLRKS